MKYIYLTLIFLLNSPLVSQQDGWYITVSDKEDYTGVSMANGRIGMLSSTQPFKVKHTVLNNVYDVDPHTKVSQVVHGMDFGNLDIYIDGKKIDKYSISNWEQTINMKEAALITSFDYKDMARFTCTVYALRNVQYSGYIDI